MHHIPGRLRVRLPGLKGSPSVATTVGQHVSAISGVLRSEPNLTTGSLVVHYDPQQTSHTAIMHSLRASGYGADRRHPAPQTVAVARVNKRRKSASPIANKLARQAAKIVVMHVLETAVKRSVPFLLKRSVPFLITALL